jgi:hypothetical protein
MFASLRAKWYKFFTPSDMKWSDAAACDAECADVGSDWMLRARGLTDLEATWVGAALVHTASRTLVTFDLRENSVGDLGAVKLAEGLRVCRMLALLNLSNNNIGDEGAASLADGLQHCPALSELYLHNNPNIGAAGATALAKILRCVGASTGCVCIDVVFPTLLPFTHAL